MISSFAYFRSALYVLLFSGTVLMTACASLPVPTADVDAAQRAVQRAETADADQYANDNLQAARAAVVQAQAAIARGRMDDARDAALAAQGLADVAYIQSSSEQIRAEYRMKQNEVAALRTQLKLEPLPSLASPLQIPVQGETLELRLQALDADPSLGMLAQYERLQAKQQIAALATVQRRALPAALAQAERRVNIAEQAARIEATRREIDRLDRERNELLLEATRREADLARAEAEHLRMLAQIQEEEKNRQQAMELHAAQQEEIAAARAKEAALARKEAELLTGAKLPPVRTDAEGEVFTLAGDAFASGQAQLTKAAAASIKALGIYLSNLPTGAITVIGHTDSQGDAATNVSLSEKRAQHVRASLVAAGASRSAISAEGVGANQPVADNKTAAGRSKNRRVEIHVKQP